MVSSILPKNERKTKIDLTYIRSNFFVRFLGELRITKSPLEINWPLVELKNFLWFFNPSSFRLFFYLAVFQNVRWGTIRSPPTVLYYRLSNLENLEKPYQTLQFWELKIVQYIVHNGVKSSLKSQSNLFFFPIKMLFFKISVCAKVHRYQFFNM